ncbi:expressed protein [Phakopsora pachyrhizi]|uniref:Expressed protein n=1 Tax=Phakopsora pachyrhizi TaxID=170000 RepID=A0AAV0BAD1_PHAPC|nr:expressed protein [Phakopsora pachyrhizi]
MGKCHTEDPRHNFSKKRRIILPKRNIVVSSGSEGNPQELPGEVDLPHTPKPLSPGPTGLPISGSLPENASGPHNSPISVPPEIPVNGSITQKSSQIHSISRPASPYSLACRKILYQLPANESVVVAWVDGAIATSSIISKIVQDISSEKFPTVITTVIADLRVLTATLAMASSHIIVWIFSN